MDMGESDTLEDVQAELGAIACALECMGSACAHDGVTNEHELAELACRLADVLRDQSRKLGGLLEG